jgi:uncharacterized membrane protein
VTRSSAPAKRTGDGSNQPDGSNQSEIELAVERALEGRVQKRDLQVVTKQITQLVVNEQFSGPLPHPKHWREYDSVLPGAAERIMTMAEASLRQNIEANQKILESDIQDRKRGMRYGAGLFGLLIVCGFASLFVTDSQIVPGLFLGSAVIGGITAFINGRKGP